MSLASLHGFQDGCSLEPKTSKIFRYLGESPASNIYGRADCIDKSESFVRTFSEGPADKSDYDG